MEQISAPHVRIITYREGSLSPKLQSLAAREALKELLLECYGISGLPAMAVRYGGKPWFPEHPGIHFNLSHCRRAAMAVVFSGEVGCDIEDIQTEVTDELLSVAFSERERIRIISAANPCVELTRIWTAKEAYSKCIGIIPDNPADIRSCAPSLTTYVDETAGFAYSVCSIASSFDRVKMIESTNVFAKW